MINFDISAKSNRDVRAANQKWLDSLSQHEVPVAWYYLTGLLYSMGVTKQEAIECVNNSFPPDQTDAAPTAPVE